MAYTFDLPDLAPYAPADSLIAIGWLGTEDEQPLFAGVQAPEEAVDILVQIHRAELPPFLPYFLGYHPCGLCSNAPPKTATSIAYRGQVLTLGCGELLIPSDGFVYVAPNLLIHYIHDHFYRPPLEFIRAVLTCPPPDTVGYRDALRVNGPASFRWDVDDPERPLWRRCLRPLVGSQRLKATGAGRRLVRVLRAL